MDIVDDCLHISKCKYFFYGSIIDCCYDIGKESFAISSLHILYRSSLDRI